MKIMSHKNSELGFTLVEMLAALVAAVVIIGAATGFMLTAAIRQLSFETLNAKKKRGYYEFQVCKIG